MNYSLLPFPFSFYPDSSAHLIRAKTNLSKSNRFHFRWQPMNMVSTSYLWKRPLWTSLETSPTVDNVVFLRMQSDALAWQMHLQSVARRIVEMSWGSRAAQVEPSWQLSPSHVRVLGGYRRALWAMLLFPAGRLAPTWCPFGQQGWTFMCLKDFPWELDSCLTPLGHLQRLSAVSPTSMVPFCFMDMTDFFQGGVTCSVKRLCLRAAFPHLWM